MHINFSLHKGILNALSVLNKNKDIIKKHSAAKLNKSNEDEKMRREVVHQEDMEKTGNILVVIQKFGYMQWNTTLFGDLKGM